MHRCHSTAFIILIIKLDIARNKNIGASLSRINATNNKSQKRGAVAKSVLRAIEPFQTFDTYFSYMKYVFCHQKTISYIENYVKLKSDTE